MMFCIKAITKTQRLILPWRRRTVPHKEKCKQKSDFAFFVFVFFFVFFKENNAEWSESIADMHNKKSIDMHIKNLKKIYFQKPIFSVHDR